MTNKEILTKAISKAIDGGWKQPHNLSFVSNKEFLIYLDELSNTQNLKWIKFKINELIFNHDFAKALWGEYSGLVPHNHVTRSEMPGYVDTTHPLHNSADIRMVQEEDMKCFSCGKVLGGHYWIANEVCWTEGETNLGWQYHLQQMVITDDPIKYLGEHI